MTHYTLNLMITKERKTLLPESTPRASSWLAPTTNVESYKLRALPKLMSVDVFAGRALSISAHETPLSSVPNRYTDPVSDMQTNEMKSQFINTNISPCDPTVGNSSTATRPRANDNLVAVQGQCKPESPSRVRRCQFLCLYPLPIFVRHKHVYST